ncbi:MAG: 3-dehydroquinate synthase [Gammaproteobacteria bacterium]|nr:3-dehydroquinate synthase [Gammaproteobacteria bacterium]
MSEPRKIIVDLDYRSYPIVIGSGLLGGGFDLSGYMTGSDCLVVSNETVAPLYLDALTDCLRGQAVNAISLPDGEAHKTTDTMHRILDKLVDCGAARDTTVIALGGGVVGDIAGFAASCYMRGVNFIQVPTTLLAQVDSSVGGKTGVNHAAGKNLIGAFYQPKLVMIDTDTLQTLPQRELVAGLAEVIKYGAIADIEFFAWLEDNIDALLAKDSSALVYAIERSCELKAQVVAEDERESGRRAILNFGHTFGHAIERCQGFGDWLHGEAIGAGMLLAAELSGLNEDELERLRTLVGRAGLPERPPPIGADNMLAAMGMDKKVQAGKIRFVLLHQLGDAYVSSEYDPDRLQKTLATANP